MAQVAKKVTLKKDPLTRAQRYSRVAKVLNDAFKKLTTDTEYEIWKTITEDLANVFAKDTPTFRKELFLKACRRA